MRIFNDRSKRHRCCLTVKTLDGKTVEIRTVHESETGPHNSIDVEADKMLKTLAAKYPGETKYNIFRKFEHREREGGTWQTGS